MNAHPTHIEAATEQAQRLSALSLRTQALALLQQAEAIDGAKPTLVHHRYSTGDAFYVLWSAGPVDEAAAASVIEGQFEPDYEELALGMEIPLSAYAGVTGHLRAASIEA